MQIDTWLSYRIIRSIAQLPVGCCFLPERNRRFFDVLFFSFSPNWLTIDRRSWWYRFCDPTPCDDRGPVSQAQWQWRRRSLIARIMSSIRRDHVRRFDTGLCSLPSSLSSASIDRKSIVESLLRLALFFFTFFSAVYTRVICCFSLILIRLQYSNDRKYLIGPFLSLFRY